MCQFSIAFNGSPDLLFHKMQQLVDNASGEIRGNIINGSIKIPITLGSVEGTYIIDNGSIDITITHKPFFASCDMIENFVKQRINS